ncbi:hypothetical protein ACRYI5_03600 [Furfurilactobacillus sp. WILCCON 0119]
MAKGFWIGALLGGAAAYAAYRALTEEQRDALRDTADTEYHKLRDRAIDYAFYAADAIDDAKDSFQDYSESASDSARDFASTVGERSASLRGRLHQKQEDFDDETASLREELNGVDLDDDDDDIVINVDDMVTAPEDDSKASDKAADDSSAPTDETPADDKSAK